MSLSRAEQVIAANLEAHLKGSIEEATPGTAFHSFLVSTLWEVEDMAKPARLARVV